MPAGDFQERFEYDQRGRQTLHVSFEGVVTQSVYNAATGRLAEQRFFDNLTAYDDGNGTPAETWAYTYDAFGRTVEVERTSAAGSSTVTMAYDARGRMVEQTSPEGTVSYIYDDLGRRTSTIVGTVATPERITSYTYDELGRLATVVEDLDPASGADPLQETEYRYDVVGNLDQVFMPNGAIADYDYDSLNRLDTLTHYAPDATPEDLSDNQKIAEFDYEVRADGKRTGVTETVWFDDTGDQVPDPHTTEIDWEYDNLGRLVDEVFNHYDDLLDQTQHFTYDLNGNRLEETVDKGNDATVDETTTYEYDANDRLVTEEADLDGDTVVDRTTDYGYDYTQQTAKTVTNADNSTVESTFAYDLQGRMEVVTVTTKDTAGAATRVEQTTYDYDHTGIRVSALHEVDTDGTFDERTLTEFLNDHRNHTGYSQVLRETHYDADTGLVTKTVDYTVDFPLVGKGLSMIGNQRQVDGQTLLALGQPARQIGRQPGVDPAFQRL